LVGVALILGHARGAEVSLPCEEICAVDVTVFAELGRAKHAVAKRQVKGETGAWAIRGHREIEDEVQLRRMLYAHPQCVLRNGFDACRRNRMQEIRISPESSRCSCFRRPASEFTTRSN
jgi:hypothetical protein